MKYETLYDLKVALNMGELPDGAVVTVAPDIVFVDAGNEMVFELARDEFAFEALQMLGIPAELFTE